MTSFKVGILVFPQVQQLDLTGPYDVLASLPEAEVKLVWKDLNPVTSATGLILLPDTTLEDSPGFDLLCVPGGPGVNALMEDQAVLEFLKTQAVGARAVTSVCTGSLVLAAAGLLEGRRATSHWASHDLLTRFGAIPVRQRVVRDGSYWSGGGVTAGIDMALAVIGGLFGQAAAERIQLNLEYAPEPPYDAGTPDTAPPEVVEAVRTRGAATRAEREAIVGRLEAARAKA